MVVGVRFVSSDVFFLAAQAVIVHVDELSFANLTLKALCSSKFDNSIAWVECDQSAQRGERRERREKRNGSSHSPA